MDKDIDELSLSRSTVTLKLASIQQRCSQLMDEPDSMLELALEEPAEVADENNPYNRGY
jgi:hypothetical protein